MDPSRVSSLIAREVHTGALDAPAAARADARFEAMLDESFSVLLPSAADFGLAKRYLGEFATGLRARDAVHLAVAYNHRAAAIGTLDRVWLKAGEILRLPVSTGMQTG